MHPNTAQHNIKEHPLCFLIILLSITYYLTHPISCSPPHSTCTSVPTYVLPFLSFTGVRVSERASQFGSTRGSVIHFTPAHHILTLLFINSSGHSFTVHLSLLIYMSLWLSCRASLSTLLHAMCYSDLSLPLPQILYSSFKHVTATDDFKQVLELSKDSFPCRRDPRRWRPLA